MIEMKGQGFKRQSIGFMRRSASLTVLLDTHQLFVMVLAELLEKGFPLSARDLTPTSRFRHFLICPHLVAPLRTTNPQSLR